VPRSRVSASLSLCGEHEQTILREEDENISARKESRKKAREKELRRTMEKIETETSLNL